MWKLLVFLCMHFMLIGQNNILILSKNSNLCLKSIGLIDLAGHLPKQLSPYRTIFIFSNSKSVLSKKDLSRVIDFLTDGGNLYLGSESWPFQAESNQITRKLFHKECYGNFEIKRAEPASEKSNLHLIELKEIPAGETTVAFPLDYRLLVEAWVGNQPLILSGSIEQGRIIIDGGYSRFYCVNWNSNTLLLFQKIIAFFT
jgi:hypothetical protein